MPARLLLALGLLLVLAGGASAASFDCRKAETAIEIAICDNPALSDLDERMADAYGTAIDGLSKPALATMRRGQRSWLDFVQRVCSDDGEIPDAYSDANVECLQLEFTNRTSVLETARQFDGWRVYLDQSYEAIADANPDTNQFSKVASKVVVSPRIDDDGEDAQAFNAFMDEYIAARLSEGGTEGGGIDLSDSSSDNILRVSIDAITAERITVVVDDYWYGHGAAHGNYTYTYLHYLTGDQRALTARDIFTRKGWQGRLGRLVASALKDQLGDMMWDDVADDIVGWAGDAGRWNFSPEGLIVQFQPYEVASYADGAPTVTIPWDELERDLARAAMDIIGN